MTGSNSDGDRSLAKPLGAVLLLVLAAVVLRLVFPSASSQGSPRETARASQSGASRAKPAADCRDAKQAFEESVRVARREAERSEHPWAWALVLRTLGEARKPASPQENAPTNAAEPKLATALATFVHRSTPTAPGGPAALSVFAEDGPRSVQRHPNGIWATLLSVDSLDHGLRGADDAPLEVDALVRAALAETTSPKGRSETDAAWAIDALTLSVARATQDDLAQQARKRLGAWVEWALRELELRGRTLAPFAETGSLSAEEEAQIVALRKQGAGWFGFEHAGLLLSTVVIRGVAVLGDPALTARGQRLLATTVGRRALERHAFVKPAPTTQDRLAALRYFTGVLEVIGAADSRLNGAKGAPSTPALANAIREAAVDAIAIQRALARDGQGAPPGPDPDRYFEWLETVLQSARGFQVAARACP